MHQTPHIIKAVKWEALTIQQRARVITMKEAIKLDETGEKKMKKYKVWFIGTSNYAIIKASSRNIARILFADSHQVIVTSYIQARIAKQSEVQS